MTHPPQQCYQCGGLALYQKYHGDDPYTAGEYRCWQCGYTWRVPKLEFDVTRKGQDGQQVPRH